MPFLCPSRYTKDELRRIRSLNIRKEVVAGKALPRSVAIALSQERRCKERKKRR